MITLDLTPSDARKLQGHLEWLARKHEAAAPLAKNQAAREATKNLADDCDRLARLIRQAVDRAVENAR